MQLKTKRSNIQLTPRQLQLLKLIEEYHQDLCYSPTLAEMASQLGISRSTVFEHIAELRKKGLLSGNSNKARSLKLTSKAQGLLKDVPDITQSFEESGIPLAGIVAAGLPLEAIENTELLSLDSCFGKSDDIFALEVTGNSMIDDNIHQGDYVICRRSSTARDGQIIVAILDNDNATIKRFYKEHHCVRLQPANDSYEPIYSEDCCIEAVVIGLIRKF